VLEAGHIQDGHVNTKFLSPAWREQGIVVGAPPLFLPVLAGSVKADLASAAIVLSLPASQIETQAL
jgi:hypothetical protein